MQGEGIVSIELAVGAAAIVLGARLFALIRAKIGVPEAQKLVLDALATGDHAHLEKKTRGLGYRNPFGEVAAKLIDAHHKETKDSTERLALLERATGASRRRVIRRTQQGQAMDLVAFSVALTIVAFARDGFPTSPLFRCAGGLVLGFLLSSIIARAWLQASVLAALESLRAVLVTRPQLPSLSGEPVDCFWCGGKTKQVHFDMRAAGTVSDERVLATVCQSCGKIVATLNGDSPPDSVDSSAYASRP